MSAPPIDEAVRQVRAGDMDAFRVVIAAYEAQLRVVVGTIVPARAPVDDLVQEAFISAYLRLGEYRLGTDFGAWLRTLARHLALNERRRLERRRGLERVLAEELESRLASHADQLMGAMADD